MKIGIDKRVNEYLKPMLDDFYGMVSIRPIKNTIYNVEYVSIYFASNTSSPQFNRHSKTIDMKELIRDINLDKIFNSKTIDFDVEDIIFTDSQREKVEGLRNAPKYETSYNISKAKKEYSESFALGQSVWYKHNPGIITFKHIDKYSYECTRWSVKVKDTEYRYVDGTDLINRIKIDMPYVEVDPVLNKLSTEKLLKMYKRGRNKNSGKGNILIKRILDGREHIPRDISKVINVG